MEILFGLILVFGIVLYVLLGLSCAMFLCWCINRKKYTDENDGPTPHESLLYVTASVPILVFLTNRLDFFVESQVPGYLDKLLTNDTLTSAFMWLIFICMLAAVAMVVSLRKFSLSKPN